MRNQYKGICYRCAKVVEPGAGHFERVSDRQRRMLSDVYLKGRDWVTQHADCAIQYRGTTHVHESFRNQKND